jgi:hypothetical protein
LAAYADGELDAEGRVRVEQWLADHPEALTELHTQRELSPANVGLWERAEPPEPTPAAWEGVRRGIAAGLEPSHSVWPARRPWRNAAWVLGGVVAAGVAAAIAWVALGPNQPTPQTPAPDVTARVPPHAGPELAPIPRDVSPDPQPPLIAGFAVLPIATDDEVILERVPNMGVGFLPVGRHPLPALLSLASVGEVELEEADPSPLWPMGLPKMTNAPGDIPMIFVAKPR